MSPKQSAVSLWLDEKFLAWRAAQRGHRAGVTQFAQHLGISRDDLNNYMLKGIRPEGERLEKIAQALGPEVYDLLGLPRPDPHLRQITEAFLRLPEAQRGVAEAVLRQPNLLEMVGQIMPPEAAAPSAAASSETTAQSKRRGSGRRSAQEEWRELIKGLDDAQVQRLLAMARAMREQELKEQEK